MNSITPNLSGPDLKSMTRQELEAYIREMGMPAYRASQIYKWMHADLARSYSEMTNLPRALREELLEKAPLFTVKKVDEQVSRVDGTRKYLFAMQDGALVESVFMRYRYGCSVCVSSQVGCRMGCQFCASTIGGLVRNLLPSEILEQVYEISRLTGERISHVVVMGTGEPMDNYDNVVRFVRLLTDEAGLHISQRNITISTCGIVPGIERLAEEKLQITLALSLHAVSDKKRMQIMPVAKTWSIEELMKACGHYFEKTGRRVTFEYSLIGGVNDTREDAEALAALAGRVHAHINLIPVNPVKERSFRRPDRRDVLSFKNKLEKSGANVSIRRALGRDIDGACGQLRRRTMQGQQ
ncbi:MAG: 23S rRNA (adenine(2503)-C(2))-methyltransferase RlmN [Lachnospiraceae bacterium]|nr:23S rRNA (adenine(2503)-C(2))-methyltransferase RlmN [Lachnospiraceae bacterium]